MGGYNYDLTFRRLDIDLTFIRRANDVHVRLLIKGH